MDFLGRGLPEGVRRARGRGYRLVKVTGAGAGWAGALSAGILAAARWECRQARHGISEADYQSAVTNLGNRRLIA
jgi:hypothetical protein